FLPYFVPQFPQSMGQQPSPHFDPLVLDLNGGGVQTTAAYSGVDFDVNNTGFNVLTGWVASGDGILVYDPDNTGTVTDGSQLFGTAFKLPSGALATDGLQALASLDSNSDGKITSADTNWSSIKVWVDSNGNGVVDSGELETLSQAGIATLN